MPRRSDVVLRRAGLRTLALTPGIELTRLGRALRALAPSSLVLDRPEGAAGRNRPGGLRSPLHRQRGGRLRLPWRRPRHRRQHDLPAGGEEPVAARDALLCARSDGRGERASAPDGRPAAPGCSHPRLAAQPEAVEDRPPRRVWRFLGLCPSYLQTPLAPNAFVAPFSPGSELQTTPGPERLGGWTRGFLQSSAHGQPASPRRPPRLVPGVGGAGAGALAREGRVRRIGQAPGGSSPVGLLRGTAYCNPGAPITS